MTYNDPFAESSDEAQSYEPEPQAFEPPPAEPEPAPEPKKAPAKKAAAPKAATPKVESSSDSKVVLTFKGGTGFDAPWIVIHADDLDDALGHVSGDNAETLVELMRQTQKAGSFFAGQAATKAAGAAPAQQRQPAPQAAQSAPSGETRSCKHGEMRFKSGVGKASGKPYSAFFCASRDRNDECPAQFLR